MMIAIPCLGLAILAGVSARTRRSSVRTYLSLVLLQFGLLALAGTFGPVLDPTPSKAVTVEAPTSSVVAPKNEDQNRPSSGRRDGVVSIARQLDGELPKASQKALFPIAVPAAASPLIPVGPDVGNKVGLIDPVAPVTPADPGAAGTQGPLKIAPAPLTQPGISTTAAIPLPGFGNNKSLFNPPSTDRVVFVLDVSGSMRGPRYDRVKAEMRTILTGLEDGIQFQVFVFDTNVRGYIGSSKGQKPAFIHKTDEAVKDALKQIDAIGPDGGTNPQPAILQALALNPVEVFLLSDGEFSIDMDKLKEANTKNAPIHGTLIGDHPTAPKTSKIFEIAGTFHGLFNYCQISEKP